MARCPYFVITVDYHRTHLLLITKWPIFCFPSVTFCLPMVGMQLLRSRRKNHQLGSAISPPAFSGQNSILCFWGEIPQFLSLPETNHRITSPHGSQWMGLEEDPASLLGQVRPRFLGENCKRLVPSQHASWPTGSFICHWHIGEVYLPTMDGTYTTPWIFQREIGITWLQWIMCKFTSYGLNLHTSFWQV